MAAIAHPKARPSPRRWRWFRLAASYAALAHGSGPPDGNCGVEVKIDPQAGREGQFESASSEEQALDLEDELWSMEGGRFAEDRRMYEALKRSCGPERSSLGRPDCRTFGVRQWNLSRHSVAAVEGIHDPVDGEDGLVYASMERMPERACRGRATVCQRVGGRVRIVGVQTSPTRRNLEAIGNLTELFSLWLDADRGRRPDGAALSGVALPPSLRLLTLSVDTAEDFDAVAPLLRAQRRIQSIILMGNPKVERWIPLDLSAICDLRDLRAFSAYVLDIGRLPACWSKMRRLERFYCTNCMLTSAPTPLRGLLTLRSFVAFRQSEMTPCVYKSVFGESPACKLSWESKTLLKDGWRSKSTGRPEDFQHGPSFMCPSGAFSFDFKEFVDMGWDNLEKLWLDGNFITGRIPANISKVWPSLQSLDLYDNLMEGPIPASLAELDLVKLQLQANNFSGRVPTALLDRLRTGPLMLGLAGNPALRGCLPHRRHAPHGVLGTKFRPCSGGDGGRSADL